MKIGSNMMVKYCIKNDIITLFILFYVACLSIIASNIYYTYVQYKLYVTIILSFISAINYAV